MKRSLIYTIIGFMITALVGVMGIQYYLFQNTLSLKESQFSYSVNMAMSRVGDEILRHDARERLQRNQSSKRAMDRLDSIQRVFTTGWDKVNGYYMQDTVIITDEGTTKMTYATYTDLGQEVNDVAKMQVDMGDLSVFDDIWMQDMLSGMMDMEALRPIQQRIDYATLDSIATGMFDRFGIDTDLELAVFDSYGQPVIYDDEEGLEPLVALSRSEYRIALDENRITINPHYLHLRFPEERSYVMSALLPMLFTSGALMLMIMGAFAVTIYVVFRQKKVSEIKNDFISNMTHELKTPVSTIALACEALSDPDMRQLAGSTDRYVGMIREENKRLGTLVETVLQTALVDKGELKLSIEEVSMHEAIERAVEAMRLAVEKRGGEIRLSLSSEDSTVLADKVHLQNIIGNLLDNAIKYSPESPDIEISTQVRDQSIVLTVTDKGIGISREHQRRIFDTLYRVPTGNTHDVKGFGLGLSYVKAVVNKQEGSLSLKSELGKGSSFAVTLPRPSSIQ